MVELEFQKIFGVRSFNVKRFSFCDVSDAGFA